MKDDQAILYVDLSNDGVEQTNDDCVGGKVSYEDYLPNLLIYDCDLGGYRRVIDLDQDELMRIYRKLVDSYECFVPTSIEISEEK